jgi:hypothetical protein
VVVAETSGKEIPVIIADLAQQLLLHPHHRRHQNRKHLILLL